MAAGYAPARGDVVWLQFTPQAGHEQAGHRPALVVSPESYNRKVGLAIFCPITNQEKGYPFEVLLPQGLKVTGVVLSDQLKSLDWKARKAKYVAKIPDSVMSEVLAKAGLLLS
jgi:mRNA interferase MazF